MGKSDRLNSSMPKDTLEKSVAIVNKNSIEIGSETLKL